MKPPRIKQVVQSESQVKDKLPSVNILNIVGKLPTGAELLTTLERTKLKISPGTLSGYLSTRRSTESYIKNFNSFKEELISRADRELALNIEELAKVNRNIEKYNEIIASAQGRIDESSENLKKQIELFKKCGYVNSIDVSSGSGGVSITCNLPNGLRTSNTLTFDSKKFPCPSVKLPQIDIILSDNFPLVRFIHAPGEVAIRRFPFLGSGRDHSSYSTLCLGDAKARYMAEMYSQEYFMAFMTVLSILRTPFTGASGYSKPYDFIVYNPELFSPMNFDPTKNLAFKLKCPQMWQSSDSTCRYTDRNGEQLFLIGDHFEENGYIYLNSTYQGVDGGVHFLSVQCSSDLIEWVPYTPTLDSFCPRMVTLAREIAAKPVSTVRSRIASKQKDNPQKRVTRKKIPEINDITGPFDDEGASYRLTGHPGDTTAPSSTQQYTVDSSSGSWIFSEGIV